MLIYWWSMHRVALHIHNPMTLEIFPIESVGYTSPCFSWPPHGAQCSLDQGDSQAEWMESETLPGDTPFHSLTTLPPSWKYFFESLLCLFSLTSSSCHLIFFDQLSHQTHRSCLLTRTCLYFTVLFSVNSGMFLGICVHGGIHYYYCYHELAGWLAGWLLSI